MPSAVLSSLSAAGAHPSFVWISSTYWQSVEQFVVSMGETVHPLRLAEEVSKSAHTTPRRQACHF